MQNPNNNFQTYKLKLETEEANTNIIILDKLKENTKFIVSDNENKTFVILLIESKNYQGNVEIIITGKNANVQILGIIIGFGKQKINLYTLQNHLKRESVSDLLVKSVLYDNAKLYYQGLIKIGKDAQKSNAYQKNQNLLMSKNAWADSRPNLEILANDVRCTHGATIGRIDNNQLFYLSCRGLTNNQAQKLIVEGFLYDVLLRIPEKKVIQYLEKKINYRLNKIYKEN